VAATRRLTLSETQLHRIARALADPRRVELLRQIGEDSGPTPRYEMRATHPVSAATLSHHMKELEAADLVHNLRDGKFAFYRIRRDVLQAYIDTLAKI